MVNLWEKWGTGCSKNYEEILIHKVHNKILRSLWYVSIKQWNSNICLFEYWHEKEGDQILMFINLSKINYRPVVLGKTQKDSKFLLLKCQ